MSKYRFVEVKDAELWNSVVVSSLQYTIFSNSNYLRFIERKYALFFVYKGQQIKAAVSLILSDDEKRCEIDDLSIYNGILFFNNIEQKRTNSRVERFELTEFIIEELNNANNSYFDVVVGDANSQTIHEIWHGKKLNQYRKIYRAKKGYLNIELCKICYYPRSTTREEKAYVNGREIRIENYINRKQTIGE